MTLHAAIEKLLKFKAKPMSIQEIADELNAKGWYQKKNGAKIQAIHIHGRTRSHKEIFVRKGTLVALIGQLKPAKALPKTPKDPSTRPIKKNKEE